MFIELVGLTAIEVSLCGPTDPWAQSVLTFSFVGSTAVVVVQNAVPVLTFGAVPNCADVSGAGAPITLCEKLIGCGLVSAAAASDWPTTIAATAARTTSLSLTTTSLK